MTKSDRGTAVNRRSLLAAGALIGAVGVSTAPAASAASGRYARGMAVLRRVSGDRGAEVIESLSDVAPDLGRYVVEFAYGDVYARPGLDLRQRQLVTIGALAAQGDTAPQLRFHLDAALQVGLSPVEVVEALIHIVPFMGFPRALNAVNVAREVFADRGTTFRPPVQTDERDRYERGVQKLVEVDGQHGLDVIESLRDIAPDLGRYVVEFAFGDVYHRPWLTAPQRQLVTIGALTAFGDTAPQLRVHLGAALRVGLSRGQVVEALIHVVPYAGFPRVLNAVTVARDVFEELPG
ncbi:carboxymuconolactone decarboxylase family protein [Saccharothrix deserti]|uniref:carboxymuconolactone decarboxylase family protein n=1 Tax=Saccharothrix deserti TaxID=2593674 RepID=UPI00131A7981|nr:carboxymuconolactone decarboxylase family protein [Saccharothrix deserti]